MKVVGERTRSIALIGRGGDVALRDHGKQPLNELLDILPIRLCG